MLSVAVGMLPEEECIRRIDGYFDDEFEQSWLSNDLSRRIIKDIDDSDCKSGYIISSPVYGDIPPQYLSTGCKTLLLLLNSEDDLTICGERLGDNCFKWLPIIAERRNIRISLDHIPRVDRQTPFKAYIENADKTSVLWDDFEDIIIECSNEGRVYYAEC